MLDYLEDCKEIKIKVLIAVEYSDGQVVIACTTLKGKDPFLNTAKSDKTWYEKGKEPRKFSEGAMKGLC